MKIVASKPSDEGTVYRSDSKIVDIVDRQASFLAFAENFAWLVNKLKNEIQEIKFSGGGDKFLPPPWKTF